MAVTSISKSSVKSPFTKTNMNTGFIPMVASGGVESTYTSGGVTYKVHTFNSSGTFVVESLGLLSNSFDYILIAGGGRAGGAASGYVGGGGGAGGYLVGGLAVLSPQSITITVGLGGTTGTNPGANGGNSSIGSVATAIGGGGGGYGAASPGAGQAGGSGGGGGGNNGAGGAGTAGQGFNGASGQGSGYGGGGGGAGGASTSRGGGVGKYSDITGSYLLYARGGGVPFETFTPVANRGEGGSANSGDGTDGVVIIRYAIA